MIQTLIKMMTEDINARLKAESSTTADDTSVSQTIAKPNVLSSTPTVEFCYRWPDGRIEVRYRRDDGTADCESMKAEIEVMKSKQGDNCPYFWRIA